MSGSRDWSACVRGDGSGASRAAIGHVPANNEAGRRLSSGAQS